MSITELFKKIGAPLANQRWSWGAVRPTDGCVVLRVWSDELRSINGSQYARITWFSKFIDIQQNPGYKERLSQVEYIKNGSLSLMVVCTAKEGEQQPKVIKSFNDKYLFRGGTTLELDGDFWLQLTDKIPVRNQQIE
jgi:hypothetical protein